jgi:uncharacterized protein YaiE (UPF0345 family)
MSDSFENVKIDKKANIYFDGKVTSRTVVFADGTTKTLGIMMPGEYEFGTNLAEVMEISSGQLRVKLPNSEEFEELVAPTTFNVPANSKFQVEVKTITDYCCSYIK